MEIQLNNKTLFKFSFTYDISKNIVTVNGDVLSQGDVLPQGDILSQGDVQDTIETTQESQITKDEFVDISKVDIKEYCNIDGSTLYVYLMLSGKSWGIAPYENTTGYSGEECTKSRMDKTMIAKPIIRNEYFTEDLDNIINHIKDTGVTCIVFMYKSHDIFHGYYYWLDDRETVSSKEFMNKLMSYLDENGISLEYKSKPILK